MSKSTIQKLTITCLLSFVFQLSAFATPESGFESGEYLDEMGRRVTVLRQQDGRYLLRPEHSQGLIEAKLEKNGDLVAVYTKTVHEVKSLRASVESVFKPNTKNDIRVVETITIRIPSQSGLQNDLSSEQERIFSDKEIVEALKNKSLKDASNAVKLDAITLTDQFATAIQNEKKGRTRDRSGSLLSSPEDVLDEVRDRINTSEDKSEIAYYTMLLLSLLSILGMARSSHVRKMFAHINNDQRRVPLTAATKKLFVENSTGFRNQIADKSYMNMFGIAGGLKANASAAEKTRYYLANAAYRAANLVTLGSINERDELEQDIRLNYARLEAEARAKGMTTHEYMTRKLNDQVVNDLTKALSLAVTAGGARMADHLKVGLTAGTRAYQIAAAQGHALNLLLNTGVFAERQLLRYQYRSDDMEWEKELKKFAIERVVDFGGDVAGERALDVAVNKGLPQLLQGKSARLLPKAKKFVEEVAPGVVIESKNKAVGFVEKLATAKQRETKKNR